LFANTTEAYLVHVEREAPNQEGVIQEELGYFPARWINIQPI
jgi:hypothetical protein